MSLARFLLGIAWRCAALILAYGLWVRLASPVPDPQFLSAVVHNRVEAEHALAFPVDRTVLIVGSSMIHQLEPDLPGFLTVDLIGDGAATVGALLLAEEVRPRAVVIEMNTAFRPPNGDFIAGIRSEPRHALFRFSPAFQAEYRPLLLFDTGARRLGLALAGKAGSPVPDLQEIPPTIKEGPPYGMEQGWEDRPGARAVVAALREQAMAWERRGVPVFLLHLPFHPEVQAKPFLAFVDAEARRALPPEEWRWIDFPSDGTYYTYDGVHLRGRSARAVAERIAEEVEARLALPERRKW